MKSTHINKILSICLLVAATVFNGDRGSHAMAEGLAAGPNEPPLPEGPGYQWHRTDHSLALVHDGQIVRRSNHAVGEGMPYVSPAVLFNEPYTLPAGKSFTLQYRILLRPVPQTWNRWSDNGVAEHAG